jgi:hypothetical protein
MFALGIAHTISQIGAPRPEFEPRLCVPVLSWQIGARDTRDLRPAFPFLATWRALLSRQWNAE